MGLFDMFKNEDTGEDDSFVLMSIDTDEVGFKITNQDDELLHQIQWTEVSRIYFNDDIVSVTIEYGTGKKLVVTHEYSNWPLFLKSVPSHYKEFDQTKVNKFFETLEGCQVCGLTAVYNEVCENCGNGVFDVELDGDEFENETAYYKQMQLDFFDLSIEPEEGTIYKIYPGWKALITEKELNDYTEEKYG
jgi:hypothetical protein